MPYTTKPRSSQQDYTPERRHFTQKNVSQVFAEDPKAKSTKEGLPTNPTYKSQEMGDILSGTPDHNNTTYRSPKKQVEPPKEREPATPGRKKVVDKPQGHGYEEILNPKPAPLEDRRVKKTQVGTLLENNEHPDTEALQEPPRSERKHFKTPIQPDENYFSEAKALAYDRRNNSRKVIIASDETPYSEKKCIDELDRKLAKALGRKKPVQPPQTHMLYTHFTTNIKYDPHSNKKQVEYQPQKSKRGAASTPALPERKSVQTLSDVAARRLPEEENSAEAGSSRASSRAPSRATSSAAKQLFQYKENASTTHPSGSATSAEAAASSRKAGSEAGEKEAAMRLREENSAAKRAARLADNAQPGFDPSPKPRSNTSVTSAVAGSSRAPSSATSAEAAASSRKAGSVRSESSIFSTQLSSKASATSAEAAASSNLSGYELYGDTSRFENDELTSAVNKIIKRYKTPDQPEAGAKPTALSTTEEEEEAKKPTIQERIKAQQERLKEKATERTVEEVKRQEAIEKAKIRAERIERVKSLAGFYSRHTADTIEGMNKQINDWQQTHETDSNKCDKTDLFLTKTKEEVGEAKKNKRNWDEQIECLDRELEAFKQAIRKATGSAISTPNTSGTHEILGWREKVSQGTGSAAQEGDLSLIKRLEMRKESIEAGTDPSQGR
ncbi:MAG: hypothetical protein ISP24_02565 [Rickettsiales bacterium]|nr:hypothetical protein [Rickettsiales bacterium]